MLKRDVEVFKQAILNEVEGYEFYKMAAYNTTEDEVKKAFLNLANEELKHIDWLKDAFKKLSGNSDDQVKLATIENPPSPAIFRWENLQAQNANIAVTVFGIGMEMERASVVFYDKAAKETSIEAARQLFEVLSKWEQVHLEQFSSTYDVLMKDWWADQGFDAF